MRRKFIVGNWKMHGLREGGTALASDLAGRMLGAGDVAFDMLLCPPATLIHTVVQAVSDAPVSVGGQDCHGKDSGAHTGDIGAPMLADAGCRYVIVGHSERRQGHGEQSVEVRAKAAAAHRAGLIAIVCVGETEAERDAGRAMDVIARMVDDSMPEGATAANTVVAYEPVWAIGTGRTPTPRDVAAMHSMIRGRLATLVDQPDAVRILYGGSVKPDNAASLLHIDDVDGALVGGASLKADEFWAIAETCR
ncbi:MULTISPECIES: triose-phosphate isomerase [Nitrospirillum]|uniref:Triosephosphate isomerase n=2 Tax=Nitrospirillum TaxID=1543705 RepID=A0A248JPW4_9PROT|nr:triose-phosphate isomerase [Nitrospirillum amazonense]ASG20747.1 triose-phosphate isomerase [Nitrospirillum amazonense CBAmc]MEC4592813.1 triose-phosphate isomerase [Nitrospirillum amazonense]TWB17277.1 triosephosphate isomerase [Nitrospirillum amazonense]TWB37925.1 triosephosphate isomerase [Nitrospirillum amazonense]